MRGRDQGDFGWRHAVDIRRYADIDDADFNFGVKKTTRHQRAVEFLGRITAVKMPREPCNTS